MKYEIIKLDRRHRHYKIYKYSIEFSKASWASTGTGALDFDRARRWFNTNFGWSQEAEVQQKLAGLSRVQDNDINFHWAFTTQYKNYRIYVNSDKELAWFQLSHVRDV